MGNIVLNLLGYFYISFILSAIIWVMIKTMIKDNMNRQLKLDEKVEKKIVLSITLIIFVLFKLFESYTKERNEDIIEIINRSDNIQELRENLINEEIFEDI